ncbi:hypothetical protein FB451DRAFT_1571287, partial [Mycena latifolia]
MIPPLSLLATLPLHRSHNSLGHRQRAPASHVFAPIGNAAYSRRPGVPASSFDVTLMPGEHFTAIRDPPPPTVYFTGDTSYRPMPFSTDDGPEILPVCPAFKDFALHVADPQRHRRKTCAQDALQGVGPSDRRYPSSHLCCSRRSAPWRGSMRACVACIFGEMVRPPPVPCLFERYAA